MQDHILQIIGKTFGEQFYLTGGTALSRFYFNHRLSKDLIMFSVKRDMKNFVKQLVKPIEELGYKVEIQDLSYFSGRFFVHINSEQTLRVDLIADRPIGERKKIKSFYVDNVDNIMVKKFIDFNDSETKLEDLIDLYFIVKETGVQRVIECTNKEKLPIPYEAFFDLENMELTGEVLLLKEIDLKDFEEFLKNLIYTLKKDVEKKVKEAEKDVDSLIRALLWDFPPKYRRIDKMSLPILKRRRKTLSLPKRIVLERRLDGFMVKT